MKTSNLVSNRCCFDYYVIKDNDTKAFLRFIIGKKRMVKKVKREVISTLVHLFSILNTFLFHNQTLCYAKHKTV